MAEPGPVAAPQLVEQPSPSRSPEVKSKLKSAERRFAAASIQDALPPDSKFDRQPVFLMMASGQIESAEVIQLVKSTVLNCVIRFQSLMNFIAITHLCMGKIGQLYR